MCITLLTNLLYKYALRLDQYFQNTNFVDLIVNLIPVKKYLLKWHI